MPDAGTPTAAARPSLAGLVHCFDQHGFQAPQGEGGEYGVTGSGKTSLAERLSAATGLPWHSSTA